MPGIENIIYYDGPIVMDPSKPAAKPTEKLILPPIYKSIFDITYLNKIEQYMQISINGENLLIDIDDGKLYPVKVTATGTSIIFEIQKKENIRVVATYDIGIITFENLGNPNGRAVNKRNLERVYKGENAAKRLTELIDRIVEA